MSLTDKRLLSAAAVLTLLSILLPSTAAGFAGPDVSISDSDIQFSNDYPKNGDQVTINITAHNIGDIDSGNVNVRIYIDGIRYVLGDRTITNIPKGEARQVSTTWLVATLEGTHSIKVSLECFADTNGQNNNASKPITVTSSGGPLDITAELKPASCHPAENFTVEGNVKILTQPASGAEVKVTIENGTPVFTTADSQGKFSVNQTAPASFGSYRIEVSASYSGLKGYRNLTLPVVLPNLEITKLWFSSENVTEGDQITINATILNKGNETANNVEVGFFYDSNRIGSPQIISSLNKSETKEVSINWVAAKGSHQMMAWADPDAKVLEEYEEDNKLTASLTVKEKPGSPLGDAALLIAVVVIVIAAALVAVLFLRRRKRRREESEPPTEKNEQEATEPSTRTR